MTKREFTRSRARTAAAAARRLADARTLMLVALLALGVVGLSPAGHAGTQDATVQQGISALQAGADGAALQKLEPLAKLGNPRAAYWLGRIYEDGLGVTQDIDKAVTWYRKSAEAGWAEAKFRLGEIYLQGTEELQDFQEARKWLEQAADDGNARAARDLGRLYANGWGVKKDPVWAYVWYEFAAREGDYRAERLRDGVLKTMRADEITEAQGLALQVAPEVFGLAQDKSRAKPATAPGTPSTK